MVYSLDQVFSNQTTPEKFASAIVEATTYYTDYELIGKLSKELGAPMKGIEISNLAPQERMQERGW